MDLNLRMQSILVKQQVLEALNKHENPDEEQEEDQSSSEPSQQDQSDDDDSINRDDTLKGSELLQFETQKEEDDDMDFDGGN